MATRNQLLQQQNMLQQEQQAEVARHNKVVEQQDARYRESDKNIGIAKTIVSGIGVLFPVLGALGSAAISAGASRYATDAAKTRNTEAERHNKEMERLTERGQDVQTRIARTNVLGSGISGIARALVKGGLSFGAGLLGAAIANERHNNDNSHKGGGSGVAIPTSANVVVRGRDVFINAMKDIGFQSSRFGQLVNYGLHPGNLLFDVLKSEGQRGSAKAGSVDQRSAASEAAGATAASNFTPLIYAF